MNPVIAETFSLKFVVAALQLVLWMGAAFAAEDNTLDHLGEISAQELLANYAAFNSEYQGYSPSSAELMQIEALAGKDVTILFGTWCHDSKREVPRLLKLLDQSKVELESLTLFAVDRDKTDPDGFAARLNLQYTPTIIVSESGQEVARIIERPSVGLAQDFQSQLNP